jgi:hypothetical protein
MKILENHKEQVIIQTYFIMLDSGRHIWYKEFMDPAGERVVDFDIADEDNCSILHTLDIDTVDSITAMVDAFVEHGEFAYQDKF